MDQLAGIAGPPRGPHTPVCPSVGPYPRPKESTGLDSSNLVPGEKFELTAAPLSRRGREHEVRRLINDLAALAAKNQRRAN